MTNSIVIYTDGACSGNPGPGGYGAVVLLPSMQVKELGGFEANTTNNRMEMLAAIEALRFVQNESGPVQIFTDSTYLIRAITAWIFGWKKRNWQTAEGKPVMNKELLIELDDLVRARGSAGKISWNYVRGHQGTHGNERCDQIAVAFSKGERIHLYSADLSGYHFDISKLPQPQALPEMKAAGEKKVAFSYLSSLGGKVVRHRDWSSCERRVKGQSGAKFKKAMSSAEENEILKSWGVSASSVSDEN